jgi:hypothetical protein
MSDRTANRGKNPSVKWNQSLCGANERYFVRVASAGLKIRCGENSRSITPGRAAPAFGAHAFGEYPELSKRKSTHRRMR